ncbi:ADP-glyceromanno-heptose 6-epimerase [Candidatus Omnitrophota bacterium]
MIVLTGGAGFIGSCFLWKLNLEGIDDVVVVDDLNNKDKKLNLAGKRYREYLHKDEFLRRVKANDFPIPEHIIHMGACSSTVLTDENYYIKNNYEYSRALAVWASACGAHFLYASSGATYGNGEFGFDDNDESTRKLQPLNYYGKYKHLFDLWVLDQFLKDKVTGLKFFNVFGPNEYHKKEMRSVVCKKFPEVRDEGRIRLFKSYDPGYKDGEQKRDFIYVKDAVEVMYYFFEHPDKSGIFNLGTGKAHSWNELAEAMFSALGKEPRIEYIEMPDYLQGRYQYFTEAKIEKLKDAGCRYKFRSLKDSVKDYTQYLLKDAHL